MNRTPAPPLRLRLGPSRRLAVALVVAHLLAAIGVVASDAGAPFTAAVLLVLVVSLLWYLRRHAWLSSPRSIVALELSDVLDCEIEERSGRRLCGRVLGSTFVTPWLVVINVRLRERRFSRGIVVVPDAIDAESLRKLRVWLRWRRPEPESETASDRF